MKWSLRNDDYGFLLPSGEVVSLEHKRALQTSADICTATSHQEKTADGDSGYLSPVKEKQSVSSNSVSPIYYSIDTPTIKKSQSDSSNVENQLQNCKDASNDNLSLPSSSSAKSKQPNCRRSLFSLASTSSSGYSTLQNAAKPTAEDIQCKLDTSSSQQPANVVMMVVKSHVPMVTNIKTQVKVTRGIFVTGLYAKGNYIYIKLPSGLVGCVPTHCVKPVGVKSLGKYNDTQIVDIKTQSYFNDKCRTSDLMQPDNNQYHSMHMARYRHSLASDGTYVQADLHEPMYSNCDNLGVPSGSTTAKRVPSPPPPRCILTETIKLSKNHINKCTDVRNAKEVYQMDSESSIATPAVVQLDRNPSVPVLTVSRTDQSFSGLVNGQNMSKDSGSNLCYICKTKVKILQNSSHSHRNFKKTKKFTCSSCVLLQLCNTSSDQSQTNEKDHGYESSKSDNGYTSNVNTQLGYSSGSDLIQSIDSLNDSGQDSLCSYSENSYRLLSSLSENLLKNQQLNVNNNRNQSNTRHYYSVSTSDDNFDNESISSTTTETGANLTVLFDYSQSSSHDLSLKKQEVVTLLYDKHESWYWVRNNSGKEGYVPKNYVVNLEKLNLDPNTKTTYL